MLSKSLFSACLFFLVLPVGKIGSINLFLHDILIVLCAISLMVDLKKFIFCKQIVASGFFICLAYIPGTLFSINPEEFLFSIPQLIMAFLLLNIGYVISKYRLVSVAYFQKIFIISVLCCITLCYLIFLGIIPYSEKITWVAGRFSGIYENPNVFAKMLNLYCFVLLILFKEWKLLRYMVAAGCVPLIFSAGSISGLIYFLAIFLFIFLSMFRREFFKSIFRNKLLILCSIILVFISMNYSFIEWDIFTDKLNSRISIADNIADAGSANEKMSQFYNGIEVFLSHPIWGVGIENGKYYNTVSYEIHGDNVSYHWLLVTLLVEGGLITVICYILLFYKIYCKASYLGINYRAFFLFFLFLVFVSTNIFNRFYFLPLLVILFAYHSSRKPTDSNFLFRNHSSKYLIA